MEDSFAFTLISGQIQTTNEDMMCGMASKQWNIIKVHVHCSF
jgi:hypothetical protein